MTYTCQCERCHETIRYDAELAGRRSACAVCGHFTFLPNPEAPETVPPPLVETQLQQQLTTPIEPVIRNKDGEFYKVGSILFGLAGAGLFMWGAFGEFTETESAVRQTVNALRCGFGLTVMVLSLILSAVATMIRRMN